MSIGSSDSDVIVVAVAELVVRTVVVEKCRGMLP